MRHLRSGASLQPHPPLTPKKLADALELTPALRQVVFSLDFASSSHLKSAIMNFGKRDLPAETDRWLTLAPGAAYEVRAELAFDNPGARYKIRAKYVPAMLTAEELRLLSQRGISVVQESPESTPLVVKSPNPK